MDFEEWKFEMSTQLEEMSIESQLAAAWDAGWSSGWDDCWEDTAPKYEENGDDI